jgi:RimJ/RimL family protein N-acetyltransferase
VTTSISPLEIRVPLTLEGSVVRLEPIRREHVDLFWEAAKSDLDDIFRWIPYAMKTRDDFHRVVEKALQEQERGESVVFSTMERSSGRVIGSTRYMNIDRANRRVEIGSTWMAPAWQRTAANTEAKFLMLRHAFEIWGCMRLELKTDALNHKITQCHPAARRKRRRHIPQAPDHINGPHPRHRIFQHSGHGMAAG